MKNNYDKPYIYYHIISRTIYNADSSCSAHTSGVNCLVWLLDALLLFISLVNTIITVRLSLYSSQKMSDEIIIANITSHPLIIVSHHVIKFILRQIHIEVPQYCSKMCGGNSSCVCAIMLSKLSFHLFPVVNHIISNTQHGHIKLVTGQSRRKLKRNSYITESQVVGIQI